MDHPAPQHFQPLFLPVNLKLARRICERKGSFHPPHSHVSKEPAGQPFQCLLQVLQALLHLDLSRAWRELAALEDAHDLRLMKHRIVCGVDLVSPVNIAKYYERIFAGPDQLILMGRSMAPEQQIFVDIVGIALLPGDMLLRNQEAVEILMDRDNRRQWIVEFVGEGMEGLPASKRFALEISLDFVFNDSKWVIGVLVQVAPDVRNHLFRDVAVRRQILPDLRVQGREAISEL